MLRGRANSADLAYALAASAVAEIGHRPPPGELEPLLRRLAAGEEFGAALEASTGLSVDRFEEGWQASLRHQLQYPHLAGGWRDVVVDRVWARRAPLVSPSA